MMEQTQIELDFDDTKSAEEIQPEGRSNVVHLGHFLSARRAKLEDETRSKLVASIVESVDAVWGDLEAM